MPHLSSEPHCHAASAGWQAFEQAMELLHDEHGVVGPLRASTAKP